VALGRSVGANVIAEGVETQDQLTRLRQIGCDLAQGFYFSKPLAPAAAEAFMARSPVLSRRVGGRPSSKRPTNIH
jgi:EAL domain-containing protein (putative c-di-GMP-specific phosphodiesterase class I)